MGTIGGDSINVGSVKETARTSITTVPIINDAVWTIEATDSSASFA